MKNFLYKIEDLFAPTERNGGVPWILSKAASCVFIVVAFAFLLPSIYFHASYFASLLYPAPFNESDVVELLNGSRSTEGLSVLNESPTLSAAAQTKLKHMAENGYFAHFAPDGTSPWFFIRSAGYNYYAAGENLAVDFVSAGSAHRALMNSPTHRSNIMNSLYSDIGVAVARAPYKGREAVYIVQMFGSTARQIAVLAQAPAQSEPPIDNPEETQTEPDGTTEPIPVEVPEPDEQYAGAEDVLPEEPEEITPEETIAEELEVEIVVASADAEILTRAFKAVPPSVGSAIEFQAKSERVRMVVTLVIVFSIMTSFILLLMRKHRMPLGLGLRTLLVLFIFGHLLLQPYYFMPTSKITPAATQETSLVAN